MAYRTLLGVLHLKKRAKPLMAETWLQHPSSSWTIRFHRDPDSWRQYPWYFIDRGRPIHGEPPSPKTRDHLSRPAAVNLWKDLRKEGWKKVEPQW